MANYNNPRQDTNPSRGTNVSKPGSNPQKQQPFTTVDKNKKGGKKGDKNCSDDTCK